ncbi:MAG: deoxyribose-phosphate aldolase [Clostridiales bacterium]|nr:deoxyribose-phosphate aldolase [Clostridiales bacterium]
MDNEILKRIDHTLLAPYATADDILRLCSETVRYGMAAACLPPTYVALAREHYPKLNICTVIGFPLGYSSTNAKQAETADALQDGCDEFDMVINISWAKNGEFAKITQEIAALKKTLDNKTLKVIIETCYLTQDEKIALCHCVSAGGADYIKTSSGWGKAGAMLDDIELIKKYLDDNIKIKAAGGIRSKEDMLSFIKVGCERIGTSSALKVLCSDTII